ncbi:MAG: hypothetical protein LBD45_02290 [Bacteroidales bacterium]|jgi:tetratricopeptide (TPR) repeat protein|nr:hypothetical protein [Bacteroidales bacterium]
MSEDNFSDLLARYENMLRNGENMYFDSEEFEKIVEHYENKENFNDMYKAIEEGLKQHPNDEELLIKKARCLVFKKKYNEALQLLNNSSIDVTDIEAMLVKASIYLNTKNSKLAYTLINKILEEASDEYEYMEVAEIFCSVNKFEKAISCLQKGLKKFPGNIQLQRELAITYWEDNKYVKATGIFDKLLDVNPYSATDWKSIGELYMIQTKYAKALEAFEFVLVIDETDEQALLQKGHTLMLLKDYEKAIETLTEYITLNANDEMAYIFISECYQELEEHEKSKEYAFKALQTGESIFSLKHLIDVLVSENNFIDTLQYFTKALLLAPDDNNLHLQRGHVLLELGLFIEAEVSYIFALSLSSDVEEIADAIYSLGMLKARIGRDEDALFYFEKAAECNPNFPGLALKMAALYATTKQYAKAATSLQHAIDEFTHGTTLENFSQEEKVIHEIKQILKEQGIITNFNKL